MLFTSKKLISQFDRCITLIQHNLRTRSMHIQSLKHCAKHRNELNTTHEKLAYHTRNYMVLCKGINNIV